MVDDPIHSASDKKPAAKRSFFKNRLDTGPSAKDSNGDVFSRSTRLFDEIVAETQNKRRSRNVQQNGSPQVTVHTRKKRRVSETSEKKLSLQEGKEYDNIHTSDGKFDYTY